MQIFAKKKGFTLIELLVVIAIIGILSGIVLVSLGGARSKARDAKRQSDIQQALAAQEMYYNDNENYVTSVATDSVLAIGTYLGALDDPQAPAKHYKWLKNDACTPAGQAFCVYATLESGQYFAASQRGTKLSTTTPTDGCACYQ